MKTGRPYPPDKERRVRVKVELAKKDMTISELANATKINRPHLAEVINGTRRSKKTEEKISHFFGKSWEELFPPRTRRDLEAMREAEAKRKAS